MNGREVRREFLLQWARTILDNPRLATDKPAKNEAFSAYVDSLHRDGRISDGVAHRVTLP